MSYTTRGLSVRRTLLRLALRVGMVGFSKSLTHMQTKKDEKN